MLVRTSGARRSTAALIVMVLWLSLALAVLSVSKAADASAACVWDPVTQICKQVVGGSGAAHRATRPR